LKQDTLSSATIRLIPLLSPQAFTGVALAFQDLPFHKESPFVKAFSRWTQRWTAEQSQLWLDALERQIAADPQAAQPELIYKSTLKLCARLSPLEQCRAILQRLQLLASQYPAWFSQLQEAIAMLEFRIAIDSSLRGDP
jgi:hypothetical protein